MTPMPKTWAVVKHKGTIVWFLHLVAVIDLERSRTNLGKA